MPFNTLQEVIERAKNRHNIPRLAVAAAHDEHTIEAIGMAMEENIIDPILIGEKKKIYEKFELLGKSIDDSAIVDIADVAQAAAYAVQLVRENKADFLMKGLLHTAVMLKAVLNKETGLPNSGTVSLYALVEVPAYHKILLITDPGIVINPTLDQKVAILKNAVGFLHSLGYVCPKVAALTAVEEVNPKMQETVDAKALKDMNTRGEITGCVIDGPISMDLAFSRERALIKGFESSVSGEPDILLMPNVVCGNILAKALTQLAGAKSISGALGASVPLVVTSRGGTAVNKFHSICIAAASIKEKSKS